MWSPQDNGLALSLLQRLAAAVPLAAGALGALVRQPAVEPEAVEPAVPAAKPQTRLKGPSRYTFCQHPDCAQGSAELFRTARGAAEEAGLDLTLERTLTLCPGTCSLGPFVGLPERGFFYYRLPPRRMAQVFAETAQEGRLVFPHLYLRPTKVTDSRVVFDRREQLLIGIELGLCPVDLAAYLFEFNAAEYCGKCVPCRAGMPQVRGLLVRILEGRARPEEVDLLEELVWTIADSSYCRFTEKVTAPVRVALQFGREAFARHCRPDLWPHRHHLTGRPLER